MPGGHHCIPPWVGERLPAAPTSEHRASSAAAVAVSTLPRACSSAPTAPSPCPLRLELNQSASARTTMSSCVMDRVSRGMALAGGHGGLDMQART
jgi:hypothetical protein